MWNTCFSLPHFGTPSFFPMSLCSSWQTRLNESGQALLLNNWRNDCSSPSPSAEHFSSLWQVVWGGPLLMGLWTSAAEKDQPGEASASHLCLLRQLMQKIWKIITLCLVFTTECIVEILYLSWNRIWKCAFTRTRHFWCKCCLLLLNLMLSHMKGV